MVQRIRTQFQIDTEGLPGTILFSDDNNYGVVDPNLSWNDNTLKVRGEGWFFKPNGNPKLMIGDDTGSYGYIQRDSTNDYLRLETDGTNGLKLLGNTLALGDTTPDTNFVLQFNNADKNALSLDKDGYLKIGETVYDQYFVSHKIFCPWDGSRGGSPGMLLESSGVGAITIYFNPQGYNDISKLGQLQYFDNYSGFNLIGNHDRLTKLGINASIVGENDHILKIDANSATTAQMGIYLKMSGSIYGAGGIFMTQSSTYGFGLAVGGVGAADSGFLGTVYGEPDNYTSVSRLYYNGDMRIAGALTQNSDARIKENVDDVPYGLDAISKIRPVKFNYTGESRVNMGVIAQELQEVIPELVKETDVSKGDIKNILSVNYIGLIPILIKAIKELNEKVESLSNN